MVLLISIVIYLGLGTSLCLVSTFCIYMFLNER